MKVSATCASTVTVASLSTSAPTIPSALPLDISCPARQTAVATNGKQVKVTFNPIVTGGTSPNQHELQSSIRRLLSARFDGRRLHGGRRQPNHRFVPDIGNRQRQRHRPDSASNRGDDDRRRRQSLNCSAVARPYHHRNTYVVADAFTDFAKGTQLAERRQDRSGLRRARREFESHGDEHHILEVAPSFYGIARTTEGPTRVAMDKGSFFQSLTAS